METINIYEAKTNFSKIASSIYSGKYDGVVIARNGAPYVKVVNLDYGVTKKPRLGIAEGKYSIPDDFDDISVNFNLEEA